jgi:aminopeptidase YwaD
VEIGLRLSGIRFLFAEVLALVVLVAACGGSSDAPAVTQAPAEQSGSAAAQPGGNAPDGARIFEDVKFLTDELGPRSSGTDREKRAAEWVADRLRELGYDVSLQEFSVGTQAGREARLVTTTASPVTVPSLPLGNSAAATVQGRLVVAGIGRAGDFPLETRGSVALIKRGEITFEEKVKNAAAAGATGAVIYNSEAGTFLGTLQSASIPAVTIPLEDGERLTGSATSGELRVELEVGAVSASTSQNVVAKPPGKECETVTGGHYDSVPQAPGASDNASGTAAVLEIASVIAGRNQMGSHCFVLFGAEELGLIGSRHYVSTLDNAAKERLKAMLNLDMVGVGDEAWWLIGSEDMVKRMGDLADGLNIETTSSELIRGLSSDHASFISAGVPSIMFHRWEDNLLHTPQDVTSRVNRTYLEEAARMGVALLESLSSGG